MLIWIFAKTRAYTPYAGVISLPILIPEILKRVVTNTLPLRMVDSPLSWVPSNLYPSSGILVHSRIRTSWALGPHIYPQVQYFEPSLRLMLSPCQVSSRDSTYTRDYKSTQVTLMMQSKILVKGSINIGRLAMMRNS